MFYSTLKFLLRQILISDAAFSAEISPVTMRNGKGNDFFQNTARPKTVAPGNKQPIAASKRFRHLTSPSAKSLLPGSQKNTDGKEHNADNNTNWHFQKNGRGMCLPRADIEYSPHYSASASFARRQASRPADAFHPSHGRGSGEPLPSTRTAGTDATRGQEIKSLSSTI